MRAQILNINEAAVVTLHKELVGSVQVGALSNYKLEYKWKYNSITARSVKSVLIINILMK